MTLELAKENQMVKVEVQVFLFFSCNDFSRLFFFLNVGTYLVYKTIFSTCPHELEYIFPSSIKTPHPFTSFKRKDIPSHQPIPIVIPT